MIPDFKTYIKESIWDDMQDRGTGDVEKEEDNIDLFDVKTLGEYVKKIYKPDHLITADSSGITLNMGWCFFPKTEYKITLSWPEALPMVKKLYVYGSKKFIDSLDSVYDINHPGHTEGRVLGYSVEKNHPKQLSNKFFIQFVDAIIGILENDTHIEKGVVRAENYKGVSESIWSDMEDRGTGDIVKKEDEVDHMDFDQFYEYMKKHYRGTNERSGIMKSTWSLTVPTFAFGTYINGNTIYVSLKPYSGYELITCSYAINKIKPLFKKLSDKYTVKKVMDGNADCWYEIYPKDGDHNDITRLFFLDVVDTFLAYDGRGLENFEKLTEKI